MNRTFVRGLGVLALCGVLAVAAIGITPTPAHAVTTSWLYQQVQSIKSQIAGIKSINTLQSSSILSIKRVNSSQGAVIADLEKRVAAAESQSSTLAARVSALEASSAAQEARIDELETQMAGLHVSNADLVSRMTSAETTIGAVQERLAVLEAWKDASPKIIATGITQSGSDGVAWIDAPEADMVSVVLAQSLASNSAHFASWDIASHRWCVKGSSYIPYSYVVFE